MSNEKEPDRVLTRAEARSLGIKRKLWKQEYKKVGKLKAKRIHQHKTQTKPQMNR